MEDNPVCMELFIEMEFRQTGDNSMHQCQANLPELTSSKTPVEIGTGTTWPSEEQVSTYHIADNSDEVPFFYAQDFYVRHEAEVTEFDVEVQLAQKFIDQHIVIPIVEILDTDLESADGFDSSAHRIGSTPVCELNCLVAGHKLFNAFTVSTSVPRGTMIRVWLYQNAKINTLKLEKVRKQGNKEICVNYALQVRVVAPMSKEHEEALKENMTCEHSRYLPRDLNRLRYLGTKDSP